MVRLAHDKVGPLFSLYSAQEDLTLEILPGVFQVFLTLENPKFEYFQGAFQGQKHDHLQDYGQRGTEWGGGGQEVGRRISSPPRVGLGFRV